MKAMVARSAFAHTNPDSAQVEEQVQAYGRELFSLIDRQPESGIFTRERWFQWMMQLAASDSQFKVQLFRFIDVLPMLHGSADVLDHLKALLAPDHSAAKEGLRESRILKFGLRVAAAMPWLFGPLIKSQAAAMAHQFLISERPLSVLKTLARLREKGRQFTVDLLGETVVSEREADAYSARCMDLLNLLASHLKMDSARASSTFQQHRACPMLNLSIKISALYSQIQPSDPETAVRVISARLRPLLRRAAEIGAFINFDMESYALKELTLRLFKSIFTEPEFAHQPVAGIALQAYLRDSETDLKSLSEWGRSADRRFTVRLVKGAYWDYETIIARQRNWAEPVFAEKWETDRNYEKLSLLLLENLDVIDAAFGTHNVRSIAHVLAQADRLGVAREDFEFQMLYGMAEPIKAALLELECRVREYCPVGELLPGMGYLVRRLLENSSNEGFLANTFLKDGSREELLRAPGVEAANSGVKWGGDGPVPARCEADARGKAGTRPSPPLQQLAGSTAPLVPAQADIYKTGFRNVAHTDFTIEAERELMKTALAKVRGELGRSYPLIINGQRVRTRDWLPSLNPADQKEVIGYAAQAGIKDAEQAVEAARNAFTLWSRTSPENRAKLVDRLGAVLESHRTELAALEVLEAGKNWSEADADVAEAIDFCRFYADCMIDYGRPFRTQAVPGESNHQQYWPRGVAVIIAPWNFPLAILTGMATAAVVAGNSVILKPSDLTPVIAARLVQCVEEAGIPKGVINLLTGPGGSIGRHLVAHPQVAVIAFTGSKEVGLRIWETAGKTQKAQANLKKVICEMGGKNAVIVDSDADLDEAIAGCLASAFSYQGQKCSALSRLVLLQSIQHKFLERFVSAAASLTVGPAENPGTIIGPVISRQAQERILRMIEVGKSEATLFWQGEVPNAPDACYVPPTICTNVPPSSRLFREEIFGPVLSVTNAKDFEDALRLANDSEFALTGGLYSRNPEHITRAKQEFVCGNLYINRTITGAIVERQPFGGFKMSGGGTKAGGREYLQNFMVPRLVTENLLRHGFAPDVI